MADHSKAPEFSFRGLAVFVASVLGLGALAIPLVGTELAHILFIRSTPPGFGEFK